MSKSKDLVTWIAAYKAENKNNYKKKHACKILKKSQEIIYISDILKLKQPIEKNDEEDAIKFNCACLRSTDMVEPFRLSLLFFLTHLPSHT